MEDDFLFEPDSNFPTLDHLIRHAIQLARKHNSPLIKLYADPLNETKPPLDTKENEVETNLYTITRTISTACYVMNKTMAHYYVTEIPFTNANDAQSDAICKQYNIRQLYLKHKNCSLRG